MIKKKGVEDMIEKELKLYLKIFDNYKITNETKEQFENRLLDKIADLERMLWKCKNG